MPLVRRLPDQLAVFQGASDEHINANAADFQPLYAE
jgi:hypothetical protein